MDKKYLPYIPKDDIYYFNTGNARKAWLSFGCRYVPELGMFRFLVWAPNALSVSLIGDFNNWQAGSDSMELLEGGVWCVFTDKVSDGSLYKYAVEGCDGITRCKSDPFGNFNENTGRTASIVFSAPKHRWNDRDFLEKRNSESFLNRPMSIYEVHLGSWKDLPHYRPVYIEAAEALAEYCNDMGFTHVELLPLTEYPYDPSWGYQVTGYYSPTSRYGSPEDFCCFVDTLHAAGIGVIMDWVPAHFPKDENGLAMFDGTPLFECKERRMAEHPEWGTLIFDYASQQVKSFLISSACMFLEQYHIDGLRVDAVSSMLYLNYARRDGEYTPNRLGGNINLDAVEFLQKLNETVLTNYPGVITAAEESTSYPGVTCPPDKGGLGFCLKWDMGFMHDTIDYMEVDPYFRSGCHDKLTFSMMYAFNENYVLAFSHDEVVHGKLSMINKMHGGYDTKFSSLRALYGYIFAHPGKKLFFMGNEFGQFIEWDWKSQLDWLLLEYPRHKELKEYFAELNRFYRNNPAMYAEDHSWDGFTWLNVDDASRSSVAFMRQGKDERVVCACNFTPVRYDGFLIGLPDKGKLTLRLNSDAEMYGGSGEIFENEVLSQNTAFAGFKYSAAITLPPMSCTYYDYEIIKEDTPT